MGRNGQGTPREPSVVLSANVLRLTLPGTPFRSPYPSFDRAQDRTPSAILHLFPQPHHIRSAAPRGNTPLFMPGSHASSLAPSRYTPVRPPPVPLYPQHNPYVPPPETPSGCTSFHEEPHVVAHQPTPVFYFSQDFHADPIYQPPLGPPPGTQISRIIMASILHFKEHTTYCLRLSTATGA